MKNSFNTFSRRQILLALSSLGASAGGLSLARVVQAQPFPSKPLRGLVGASAGGPSDFLARLYADHAGPLLGQSVVVDLKPGAGGSIAADALSKAPIDGHTLMFSGPAAVTVQPHLNSKLSYDPMKEFQPIAMMGAGAFVLVVHPSVQANNVAELVALLKKGEAISYGSGGNGSSGHLCTEFFNKHVGTKMLHVPYKGDGQAVTDLISGQIKLMFTAPNVGMPHVKSGRLKLLAVTTKDRVPSMPEVPTVHEAGTSIAALKDFEYLGWIIAFTHASVPAANIQVLANAWDRVRKTPAVKGKLDELAMAAPDRLVSGPALNEFVRNEYQRLGALIKETGIKQE